MGDKDVLICGTCSLQFSDLKNFINHKQACCTRTISLSSSNVTSAIQTAMNTTDVSPVIQTSSIQPTMHHQPIVIPSSCHASVVSLPVGMPHTILQAPSNLHPQIYHIVLEPGLAVDMQHNSSSQSSQFSQKLITAQPQICAPEIQQQGSLSREQKMENIKDEILNASKLSNAGSNIVSLPSNSNLHSEEEDVATFLATQLVSQAGSQGFVKLELNDSNISKSTSFHRKTPDHLQEAINSKVVDVVPNKDVSKGVRCVGTFMCAYQNCNFFTPYKKDLVRHTRKHTGEKPFKCLECGTKFSRQDKLKGHMRVHSKERPFACVEPGCSYRASERGHLRKHIRKHTNERPYKCQFCSYRAKDASHLTIHLRSHTGDTPFHCQYEGCSAAFKTSSDHKRHIKIHTGEKPFKCSECDYASALKSNLKVHIQASHYKLSRDVVASSSTAERHVCQLCPFVASSKKLIKDHRKTHAGLTSTKKYDFRICNVDGPEGKIDPQTTGKLRNSVVRGRGNNRGSKLACQKNFKCDVCGCGFVRSDSYRAHVRQHQKNRGDSATGRDVECSREPLGPRLVHQEPQDQKDSHNQSVCEATQNGTQELPAKNDGKPSSLYPLNFVISGGESVSSVPRISGINKTKPIDTLSELRNSQDITQELGGSTMQLSDTSPYVITIDGMSFYTPCITQPHQAQLKSLPTQQGLSGLSQPIINVSIPSIHTNTHLQSQLSKDSNQRSNIGENPSNIPSGRDEDSNLHSNLDKNPITHPHLSKDAHLNVDSVKDSNLKSHFSRDSNTLHLTKDSSLGTHLTKNFSQIKQPLLNEHNELNSCTTSPPTIKISIPSIYVPGSIICDQSLQIKDLSDEQARAHSPFPCINKS